MLIGREEDSREVHSSVNETDPKKTKNFIYLPSYAYSINESEM